MPDRDILYVDISGNYQKLYKQICESHFNTEILAVSATEALIKDVKKYGDAPKRIIKEVSESLAPAIEYPLFREATDWSEKSRIIDRLASKFSVGNRRAIDLVIRSCKRCLQEIRRGDAIQDIEHKLAESFLLEIYEANFESPVLSQPNQGELEGIEVIEILEDIKPHLAEHIDALAKQMTRKDSVEALRRLPRKRETIDLHTNLLD